MFETFLLFGSIHVFVCSVGIVVYLCGQKLKPDFFSEINTKFITIFWNPTKRGCFFFFFFFFPFFFVFVNRFSPMAPDSYLFSGGGFFLGGRGDSRVVRCQWSVYQLAVCPLHVPPKARLLQCGWCSVNDRHLSTCRCVLVQYVVPFQNSKKTKQYCFFRPWSFQNSTTTTTTTPAGKRTQSGGVGTHIK